MKFYFLIFLCLVFSCDFLNENNDPYKFLKSNTNLIFSNNQIQVIDFKSYKSGFKNEGYIQAIYNIESLDIDSLSYQLRKLEYKELPIPNLDIGNGFNGNYKVSDRGYYKLNISSSSVIQKLIIIDITGQKIIIYKLINQ